MKHLSFLTMVFLLAGCQGRMASNHKEEAIYHGEVEAYIKDEIKNMYKLYEKSDPGWVDYYQAHYRLISGNGTVIPETVKSLRAEWKKIYDRDTVIVLNHGEPTVIASEDLAVHWNSVSEVIISKETGDTLRKNSGVWMGVWQKQDDGSWKISAETYQSKH
jgi:hypothetical protein